VISHRHGASRGFSATAELHCGVRFLEFVHGIWLDIIIGYDIIYQVCSRNSSAC